MKDEFDCFEMRKELLSQIKYSKISQLPAADMVPSSFSPESQTAILTLEVAGTQYENRSQYLENCKTGNMVWLNREPFNPYSSNAISIVDQGGKSLGHIPAQISDILSPLLDGGFASIDGAKISYLLPLSKRGNRAKKAILYVTISFNLNMPDYPEKGCTVCFLGGDQVSCWAQKLEVIRCKMSTEEASLVFEIYNRMNDEYNLDENETFYCGLENMADEVIAARAKMRNEMKPGLDYSPAGFEWDEQDGYDCESSNFYRFAMALIKAEPERYGSVEKYICVVSDQEDDYWAFKDIFKANSFDEETIYWVDYTRASEKEFNNYADAYYHWYDIAELFESRLPVDLSDPDVISIFGTEQFLAFADLSYGC